MGSARVLKPHLPAVPSNGRSLRQPARRARVVIAEDHPIMCEGLLDLLEQEPAVEVVGCAGSAHEVEHLMRTREPHLLVLDLTLGSDDGAELARRLLVDWPDLRVVVLSMHDELLYGDRLLAMGAFAYVTKDRTQWEFLKALRSALDGRVYLTDAQRERRNAQPAGDCAVAPERLLSPRELAVLRLLAAGKTAAGIASELAVAPKTVYSHRRNIGSKLRISSGREMIRYAVLWARRAR